MTESLKNRFVLIVLQDGDLKQVCALIKKSFLSMNPHWKTFTQKYKNSEQLKGKHIINPYSIDSYIMPQMQLSIKSKHGLGIKCQSTKKLICVGLTTDIVDYQKFQQKKSQTNSEFVIIKELAQTIKIGLQLQKDILSKTYIRGVQAYANYIAVDQKYIKYKFGAFMNAFTLKYLKDLGYQKMVGKSSNKMYIKLVNASGGGILCQKHFESSHGQNYGFYIFYYNLKQFTIPQHLALQWKNLQQNGIEIKDENKNSKL